MGAHVVSTRKSNAIDLPSKIGATSPDRKRGCADCSGKSRFAFRQSAICLGNRRNLFHDRERLRRFLKAIRKSLAPPVLRRSCTRWCVTAPGESCWAFAVFYAKLLKMLASGVPSTHRMTFVYTKSSHLHAARNPTLKYALREKVPRLIRKRRRFGRCCARSLCR